MAEAAAGGYTFYTSNAGLLSLREAIAAHYLRHHQASPTPSSSPSVASKKPTPA
jgi:aspartate/methionine/tyrosine aminotransferase